MENCRDFRYKRRVSDSALMLHCDHANARYTLATPGARWSCVFPTLQSALAYASQSIARETSVQLYDEMGRHLMAVTIAPNNPPVAASVVS